jgi:hypothetical protein
MTLAGDQGPQAARVAESEACRIDDDLRRVAGESVIESVAKCRLAGPVQVTGQAHHAEVATMIHADRKIRHDESSTYVEVRQGIRHQRAEHRRIPQIRPLPTLTASPARSCKSSGRCRLQDR